jgi:hypothetical protein
MLGGMNRRLVIMICVASTAFSLLVGAGLWWFLGNANDAALHASTMFATALERDDPNAAPPGASGFVPALRAALGPVSSAEVLGAHNKSVGHGDDARSDYVADVLVRAARGPAVLELAFDNHSFSMKSEKVSGLYELAPDKVDGLSPREKSELSAAYAARGGHPLLIS